MKLFWLILSIIYILSPYDLLPDIIPGWGWLDDLVVLYFAWRYYKRIGGFPFPGQSTKQNASRRRPGTSDSASQTVAKDPFEVLGLNPNATPTEIKKKYLQLASKYHPDKVEHLGEEFKALAAKRFNEIQAAYQKLNAH